LAVLCALLDRHGEVVSREELRQRLWPDGTFVDYEQSLNKAVNKLREALCDSADKPRFVETVARRGYRFVAIVEVEEAGEESAKQGERRGSRQRLWWKVAAAGLLVGVVLVTGLWPARATGARVTHVTQLTTDSRPKNLTFAVHNGRILYATSSKPPNQYATELWSVSTEGGEPRMENFPFLKPGQGAFMFQINPIRGDILIYTFPMDQRPGGLWLAGFDGTRPRRIGDAVAGSAYSVSPDLKVLLRGDKEGLFVTPVEGGPERLLVRLGWRMPSYLYWHPSGDRIGFWQQQNGRPRAWELKADGTGMRPLIPEVEGDQDSAIYSPDGKRLYFVSEGDIYVRQNRRWLGWMRKPKPERLTIGAITYSLAFEDPANPRVLYSTGRLAQGVSMKLNRRSGVFEPFLGGLSADCLDYSADGQWIAYVTFPKRELWKCRRDGSDKVLLEGDMVTYMPRWSPDGKQLAFAGRKKGWHAEPHRIYTIAADGGRSQQVKGVQGAGFDPTWSPDGKRLAFAPYETAFVPKDKRHISIVNLETGEVEPVAGSEDLFSSRWSPDGRHLVAFNQVNGQTMIYDFLTKRWMGTNAKDFGFYTWSKDNKHVYGLFQEGNALARLEVASGMVERIRSVKEFRMAGSLYPGTSWTPEFEPIVLMDTSTNEIYRIDLER
jgi:dipeptidyl aminopeptidase/acylaminoacyl peptidase